ncbi:uncharacterized protein LOC122076383 [Macadamia integrifolia]|uniref:uncharacterized protein LOC122076383 n=1 Tax=Macadamia integrifolia TaxID=60698 RepID=UPI001C4E7ABE|nr:uncharacterized protein LOC122076383 [Macadamia integrifolia]
MVVTCRSSAQPSAYPSISPGDPDMASACDPNSPNQTPLTTVRPGENHPECPILDPSSSSGNTSSSQGSDDSSGSNDSSSSSNSSGFESVEVVSLETIPTRGGAGSVTPAQSPSVVTVGTLDAGPSGVEVPKASLAESFLLWREENCGQYPKHLNA